MKHNKAPIFAGEKVADQFSWIYEAMIPLLRTKSDALDAYLETVASKIPIADTKTQAHCHFIALDGNKRPRVHDFARFIGHRIVDFAIPRSEVQRALNEARTSGSTAPIVELNKKAKSLFTTLPKSGEGGEVLLCVLAETILGLPQILTKMVLTTGSSVY